MTTLTCLGIVAFAAALGACKAEQATQATSATASVAPAPSATAAAGTAATTSGEAAVGAPGADGLGAARSGPWSFDGDKVDAPPAGFSFGRTGNGATGRWVVQAVRDAPSKPNVLVQVDPDPTDYRFPVAVADAASYGDVKVSVWCRPMSGTVEQTCGLVWRYRDANNYYLVRANAKGNSVRLSRVKDGDTVQFATWNGAVRPKKWHKLTVEARGDRFLVTFDGKKAMDAKDGTFSTAGKVGVWTKSDSVTQFDDLAVTPL